MSKNQVKNSVENSASKSFTKNSSNKEVSNMTNNNKERTLAERMVYVCKKYGYDFNGEVTDADFQRWRDAFVSAGKVLKGELGAKSSCEDVIKDIKTLCAQNRMTLENFCEKLEKTSQPKLMVCDPSYARQGVGGHNTGGPKRAFLTILAWAKNDKVGLGLKVPKKEEAKEPKTIAKTEVKSEAKKLPAKEEAEEPQVLSATDVKRELAYRFARGEISESTFRLALEAIQ